MAAKKAAAGKLAGQTFVITGTLKAFERAEARAAVEALGGSVSGSISGKTTAVVVGEDPGSKAAKGKKLGLKILNEAAFKRLVGSGPPKKKAAAKKPAKKKAAKKKGDGGKLAGQTFVMTGTLAGFERDEARAAVEALGGNVSGSISGKTTAVVVGEDPGSKAAKGKKLGLKILNEAAFKRLVGSGSAKKKASAKKPAKKKAAKKATKKKSPKKKSAKKKVRR